MPEESNGGAGEGEEEDEEIQPGDPDYDLSEAHGYTWEPRREHWPVPPWVLLVVSALVAVGLIAPSLFVLLRH